MLETLATTYEKLQLHTQQLVKQLHLTTCPHKQHKIYEEYQIVDRQLQLVEHQLSKIVPLFS